MVAAKDNLQRFNGASPRDRILQSMKIRYYKRRDMGALHALLGGGEMAEWSNAAASKAVIPCKRDRGFESPSLLHIA